MNAISRPMEVTDFYQLRSLLKNEYLSKHDIIGYINKHKLYEEYSLSELSLIVECNIRLYVNMDAFRQCIEDNLIQVKDREDFDNEINLMLEQAVKRLGFDLSDLSDDKYRVTKVKYEAQLMVCELLEGFRIHLREGVIVEGHQEILPTDDGLGIDRATGKYVDLNTGKFLDDDEVTV